MSQNQHKNTQHNKKVSIRFNLDESSNEAANKLQKKNFTALVKKDIEMICKADIQTYK